MENLTLNKQKESKTKINKESLNGENSLEKLVHNASETVDAIASDLSNRTVESVKFSRDYVKENPAKSLVIAAAAGALMGGLLTTTMRRRKM